VNKAIDNLRERLSGPRLRAPGTITTYISAAELFLEWLGEEREATPSDFRRYFMYRREQGISERTLRKDFFTLKKLALSNDWEWPFTADDTPSPEGEPNAPALAPGDIEKLIKARAEYIKSECFFLAISTTWFCRREELARVKKRDYDAVSILIHTAKHGRPVRHLIPDSLKEVFEAYRPKQHTPTGISKMFNRMCQKAEVSTERGTGFHSIRRTGTTLLGFLLPRNNLDPAMLADYMGWSKTSMGIAFRGAPMAGLYHHPEVLFNDPFGLDKVVYPLHPFLHFWEEPTSK